MESAFKLTTNDEKTIYIGNIQNNIGKIFLIISCILSILMNIIFIFNYLLKKLINKNTNKISSLEKLFFILTISESSISLLWFISAIQFSNKGKLLNIGEKNEICNGCKIIGSFFIFLYAFYWMLSGCTLYHLKNMILNPINFILKPSKKILFYLIISTFVALLIIVACYFLELIGISPMISCFLTFNNDNKTKIFTIIIILFPLYNIIFYFIEISIVFSSPSYKNDLENRRLFKNHYIPAIINHLIYLLMSSLYIIDIFKKGDKRIDEKPISWYFYSVTLIICLNPFIIGIIKLFQKGIFNILIKCLFSKSSKKELEGPLINKEEKENELNLEKFEASAVKKFVMNIFISVCYCLEKADIVESNNYNIEQNLCNETNEYTISKSEINKDLSIRKLTKDILVKSREDFNISCVEYAPKIFSYLRSLDMVKEEDLINSLLPMNNKSGIQKSEGKGGSFFLNTDDNEFSLKTITFGEAELIRGLLLCKMAEYLSNNNDSIIGRIYGVYKISIKTGLFKEDEIYFILMKNVIGSFTENLICKYDLKGSSLNRKVNLGEFVTNVMKDNNFKDIEQVLLLNQENAKKLLDVASEDAKFFCGVKVMDYSLLVAKMSLNNDEIEDLFGKNHRRRTEIEYFNMAGMRRQSNSDSIIIVSEDDNENEKLIDKYHENDEKENKKNIRYNKEKIKPLKKYFFPSLKGDVLYIIAIIDFFQLYNLQKTIETKFKLLKSGVQKKDISSMPPEGYKDRFIEFVKNITDSQKYVREINDPENKNDFM